MSSEIDNHIKSIKFGITRRLGEMEVVSTIGFELVHPLEPNDPALVHITSALRDQLAEEIDQRFKEP